MNVGFTRKREGERRDGKRFDWGGELKWFNSSAVMMMMMPGRFLIRKPDRVARERFLIFRQALAWAIIKANSENSRKRKRRERKRSQSNNERESAVWRHCKATPEGWLQRTSSMNGRQRPRPCTHVFYINVGFRKKCPNRKPYLSLFVQLNESILFSLVPLVNGLCQFALIC